MKQRRNKIKIPNRTAKFREEYNPEKIAVKEVASVISLEPNLNSRNTRRVRSMNQKCRINMDEYLLNNLRKVEFSRPPSCSNLPESTFERTSINYVQPETMPRSGLNSASEIKIRAATSKKSSYGNLGSSTNYQTRPNTGLSQIEQQAFTVKRRAHRPASFYLSNYSSQKQSQIFDLLK